MDAKQIKPTGSIVSFHSRSNAAAIKVSVQIETTESAVHTNGYTYNEAGFSYNQAGITYGGVFGYQDVRPLVSLAQSIYPTIVGAGDFEPEERTLGRGMLIGMLGLTYPDEQTFYT